AVAWARRPRPALWAACPRAVPLRIRPSARAGSASFGSSRGHARRNLETCGGHRSLEGNRRVDLSALLVDADAALPFPLGVVERGVRSAQELIFAAHVPRGIERDADGEAQRGSVLRSAGDRPLRR